MNDFADRATAAFDPGFSTAAMSVCFSPHAHVRSLLDVESALALACADAGVETRAIADEIAQACLSMSFDANQLLAEGWHVGTPVVALRAALREHVSPAAAKSLDAGHGSTTQDIVDTAMQLQIRAGLDAIARDLTILARRVITLAHDHRATPMMGRTFLQHARPTTFGLQAAHWLDPVAELSAQLQAAQATCSIQLGGPVGTLDGLGDHGQLVSEHLATRLGLSQPVASWHVDRRRVTHACTLVGQTARCMAKIATDIAILSSSDVAEIRVRAGGSSSMAGKRNPFDAVRAIATADACAGAVATVSSARPIELDRGLGGWHVEWFAVPLVFMTCAASVESMRLCLDSLHVDRDAMARQLADVPIADSTAHASRLVDAIVEQHRAFA